MSIDIVKIVYFDEGSATDYVQIREGGKLTNTMTLFDEDEDSGAAGVDAKLGMKNKATQGFDRHRCCCRYRCKCPHAV